MTTYPLARDGVFWTIQGEGTLRGTPMVFVRLAGCSVGCAQCDTDYRVAERATVEEIVTRAHRAAPTRREEDWRRPWWVWITGGEPTDHDLAPLIAGFRGARFAVALATSGVRSCHGLDISFLSVSPHAPTFVQTSGQEMKIVPGLNGMTVEALTGRDLRFDQKFVQPLWGRDAAECVAWVLANPDWALTDQGHKAWGLP